MLSLISGFICCIIGFGLILLGLAILAIRVIFLISKFIKKNSGPIAAGAGMGITGALAYKKGFKDGKQFDVK